MQLNAVCWSPFSLGGLHWRCVYECIAFRVRRSPTSLTLSQYPDAAHMLFHLVLPKLFLLPLYKVQGLGFRV